MKMSKTKWNKASEPPNDSRQIIVVDKIGHMAMARYEKQKGWSAHRFVCNETDVIINDVAVWTEVPAYVPPYEFKEGDLVIKKSSSYIHIVGNSSLNIGHISVELANSGQEIIELVCKREERRDLKNE